VTERQSVDTIAAQMHSICAVNGDMPGGQGVPSIGIQRSEPGMREAMRRVQFWHIVYRCLPLAAGVFEFRHRGTQWRRVPPMPIVLEFNRCDYQILGF